MSQIVYPKDSNYQILFNSWKRAGKPSQFSHLGQTWMAVQDNDVMKFVLVGAEATFDDSYGKTSFNR